MNESDQVELVMKTMIVARGVTWQCPRVPEAALERAGWPIVALIDALPALFRNQRQDEGSIRRRDQAG